MWNPGMRWSFLYSHDTQKRRRNNAHVWGWLVCLFLFDFPSLNHVGETQDAVSQDCVSNLRPNTTTRKRAATQTGCAAATAAPRWTCKGAKARGSVSARPSPTQTAVYSRTNCYEATQVKIQTKSTPPSNFL